MSIVNRLVDNVYVINLDSQTERMKHIDETMKYHGIKYQRFSAVKGKDIDYSEYLTPNCNQFCPDGMKGCALSHRGIWNDMVEKNYSSALILEDDVNLNPLLFEVLKNGWDSVPKDFDVLWLGCHTAIDDDTWFAQLVTTVLKKESFIVNEHITKSSCGFGTYGYIITRRCAEFFLTQPINFHIDYSMAQWIDTHRLKSYIMRDLPVRPNEELHMGSTLSGTFPKALNTILMNIPTSKQTNMDWSLGENFLKLGGFTWNFLTVLVFLAVLLSPLGWIRFFWIWLAIEFILSFDIHNTIKFAIPIGVAQGIKMAMSYMNSKKKGRSSR